MKFNDVAICISLFAIVEVFNNVSNRIFNTFFLSLEFSILLLTLFLNVRSAILILSGISLISFGAWVYVIPTSGTPVNFYGTSIFGVSTFSFVCLIQLLKLVFTEKRLVVFSRSTILLLILLILYCIASIFSEIYLNTKVNFLYDFKVYFPIFTLFILLSTLHQDDILNLFTWCSRLVVFQLLLSFMLGAKFYYAENIHYLPISNLGLLLPLLLFTNYTLLSKRERMCYMLVYAFFVLSGVYVR